MRGGHKKAMISFLLFSFIFGILIENIKADNLKWWPEARFGLFIHRGLYSVPAES